MTYTADRITQSTNVTDEISTVQATLNTLSTDEKLGLFWVIYENLGGAITPAAPGAARMEFTQGLFEKVKALVVRGRSFSPGIKVLNRLKTWVVSPEVKLPLTELNRFDLGWGETSAALY